jgi:exodeoxyribonuclease VII small subunit
MVVSDNPPQGRRLEPPTPTLNADPPPAVPSLSRAAQPPNRSLTDDASLMRRKDHQRIKKRGRTLAHFEMVTRHWTPCWIYRSFQDVANAPKTAAQANPAASGTLPFEEALKKLEGIVEAMESQDLPLETLLARYEEGTRLARICQEKLSEADLKIQQLEKTSAGEFKLKPMQLSEDSVQ